MRCPKCKIDMKDISEMYPSYSMCTMLCNNENCEFFGIARHVFYGDVK